MIAFENRLCNYRSSKIRFSILVALSVSFLGIFCSSNHAHEVAKELHDASQSFLDSLDETQKQKISLAFDDDLRKDWQFIPMERKGLSLGELKPHQRWLAVSLLQTVLSHRGFSKTMQIMALEQVLHEMENNSPNRDPEKYHLFFFGEPSLEQTWGWRVEGHHLSLSFTIVDGKQVVSTPAFFGSNPAEVRQGPQKGLRVLGESEDLGRRLVKSLTVEQKKIAIVAEEAPQDVINGPGRDATPLEPAGIAATQLNQNQRDNLVQLIECYVKKLRRELAEEDLQKIRSAGIDQVHFAWAGKIMPGQPHYFRVQGPTFVLEYDNTQNNANHAHTVWRDFKNDFGDDLLKQHYQKQQHKD